MKLIVPIPVRRLKVVRPQAQPESLYYDFHVASRSYIFSEEMLAVVKEMFPARGDLTITFRDGSTHTVDMLRRTNAFRSSPFDATMTEDDPGVRLYRWTMQYEVESYEDNTLQGEFRPTIRSHGCPTLGFIPVGLLPRGN
jgi:hypothetical protein